MRQFLLGLLVLAVTGASALGQASSQPGRGVAPVMANPDRAPNELHVGVGQVGRPVTGDVSPPTVDKTMSDLGLKNPKLEPLGGTSSSIGSSGTSGFQDFSLPNSLGDLGKTSDMTPALDLQNPQAGTSATMPAAAADGEISDKTFLEAWDKFHQGYYRECVNLLRADVRDGKASTETRFLYAASLVATGQMSTAGYETKRVAQEDAKNFFAAARRVAKRYRAEPDFSVHFDAAKKNGRAAKTLEPGLLWALYQTMEGTEENDPGVTLTLLHPGPSDMEWFQVLADSLKKNPTK